MGFDPTQFSVEEWLKLEQGNLLQKVCSIYDDDGLLSEQYKTRVAIFPIGTIYRSDKSLFAPALYRSFTYDSSGNPVGSVPEVREWTQACEDRATGDLGGPIPGVPNVDLTVATDARTTNLSIPVPSTEVSHALVDTLRKIMIRSREITKVQVSFAASETATKYLTINKGGVLCLDGLYFNSKTIYFQSESITTLEILELYS